MNKKKYKKLARKLFGSTVQLSDLKKLTVEHLKDFDRVPNSGRLLRNMNGEVHCCFVCITRTGHETVTTFEYDKFYQYIDDVHELHPRTIKEWAQFHSS